MVTGGYGRLQGVARSLVGLQEGTGGYKRLREVTGGYKRLRGVTMGYMGLQEGTGFTRG